MDDKNFDKRSADEWIAIIEDAKSAIRENDIYPTVSEWLKTFSGNKVLDLGCGQGVCSEKITFGDKLYTGVDPSEHLIQRAEQLYPGTQFLVGNAYQLPFLEDSFDGFFSIAVWHILSDIHLASHELSRVLKKNGSFFVVCADADSEEWKNICDPIFLREEIDIKKNFELNGLRVESTGKIRYFKFYQGIKI